MPDAVSGTMAAINIGTSLFKDDGVDSAVGASNEGINNAIASNRKSLEEIQKMFAPYMQAGTGALTGQQDILGVNGAKAEKQALDNIFSSPIFKGLMEQGENSILQNASATGGLRGGNVQKALGQFSPNLLNTLLQQKLQGLQGLTNLGYNATGGATNAIQNFGGINADLLVGQGRVNAGGAVSKANNQNALLGAFGNLLGNGGGLGNFGNLLGSFGGGGGGGGDLVGSLTGGSGGLGGGISPSNAMYSDLSFGMF